jgi:hypothetical protein
MVLKEYIQEERMYWINIRHPRAENESFTSHCKEVFIQNRSISIPSKGDRVFIYETEVFSGRKVNWEDESGKHEDTLRQGAKGLIALVQVVCVKTKERKYIRTDYDRVLKTNIIRKKEVSLDCIKNKYLKVGISKNFIPRSPMGLKTLRTKAEIEALKQLMGVR